MSVHSAALTITESGDYVTLELSRTGQSTLTLPQATTVGALSQIGAYAAQQLGTIRQLASGTDIDMPDSLRNDLMKRFAQLGDFTWSALLGRHKGNPPTLGFGLVHQPGVLGPLTHLELSCPDHLVLPIEIVAGLESLTKTPAGRLAECVGFGASIHRVPRIARPDEVDQHVSGSHVNAFWHRGLRGARLEEKQLLRTFGRQGVRSLPNRSDTSDSVAQAISTKDSPVTSPTAGIEHFSCHFSRTAGGTSDRIVLRSRRFFAPEIVVTAEDVSRCGLGIQPRGGIVILNACGTQSVDPRAVSSLARVLIQAGRNVVITSWCDVPDDLAAVMSDYIYEALTAGRSVSDALWVARGRMLLEHNNPLGLLYTAQGDGSYRLPRPHAV